MYNEILLAYSCNKLVQLNCNPMNQEENGKIVATVHQVLNNGSGISQRLGLTAA